MGRKRLNRRIRAYELASEYASGRGALKIDSGDLLLGIVEADRFLPLPPNMRNKVKIAQVREAVMEARSEGMVDTEELEHIQNRANQYAERYIISLSKTPSSGIQEIYVAMARANPDKFIGPAVLKKLGVDRTMVGNSYRLGLALSAFDFPI